MILYVLQQWSEKRADWYVYRSFSQLERAQSALDRAKRQGTEARLVKVSGRSEVVQ